jgi:predicted MFS family arabinose efflux permease
MAAFITLLTEIMPAGLLLPIAEGLGVTQSFAGQFITAYAAGALVSAVPMTTLTQGLQRRPLLLFAITGFSVVNLVVALTDSYVIALIARFFAGVFGGIVWSLLAGYAVRISPSHLSGRAIAIAGAGATIALVLGVPIGSLIGRTIGWQGSFALMSALALVLNIWIVVIVPNIPGSSKEQRQTIAGVFLMSGIRSVLFVVFAVVVAHNVIYIYIEPFLQHAELAGVVDVVLFIFGAGSIIGLGIVGAQVDRQLQRLTVTSISTFILASLLMGIWGGVPQIVLLSTFLWGMSFGGFATITQTALSRFAKGSIDIAQSMYTTCWNAAVTTGGVVGGVLLDRAGTGSMAWAAMGILVVSLLCTVLVMNKRLATQSTEQGEAARLV